MTGSYGARKMGISHNRGRPFPNRNASNSRKTSPAVATYNCLGWAIVGQEILFGPCKQIGWEWPDGVPSNEQLASVIAAAAAFDFQQCEDGALEPGFEKVALFGSGDWVEHASRQLRNGQWTSKLGTRGEDIEHDTPEVIAGGDYGSVLAFVKRPTATNGDGETASDTAISP